MGNLNNKEDTKQNELYNNKETELQVLQVAKTSYKREINMMTIMPDSYLHLLVIPIYPMTSAYYIIKSGVTKPVCFLSLHKHC